MRAGPAPGVGPRPRAGLRRQPLAGGHLVRRRHAERRAQLRRPARRGRCRGEGRPALGGRAGGPAHRHLRRPAARGRPLRACAHRARGGARRRRRRVPAGVGRDRRRDAGLRPDRGGPLAGLRRVLRLGTAVPAHRRVGEAARHHRRPVPAREGRPGQGQRRRGRVRCGLAGARAGDPADRLGGRLDPRPRRVVARRRRHRTRGPRGAGAPRREPADARLHLRHHRDAQGPAAHHGRLPHPGVVDGVGLLRPQARRRLLRAPPTSPG